MTVASAGGSGVAVASAVNYGVYVGSAGDDGVRLTTAGTPSTSTHSSYKNGFEVAGAEGQVCFQAPEPPSAGWGCCRFGLSHSSFCVIL